MTRPPYRFSLVALAAAYVCRQLRRPRPPAQ